jgi:hypothetical protein
VEQSKENDSLKSPRAGALESYGFDEWNLSGIVKYKKRIMILEKKLKQARDELTSTRSQEQDIKFQAETLGRELDAARIELALLSQSRQRAATDATRRTQNLEEELEKARSQIKQLSKSALSLTPPNISSKIHLQPGDYFYLYNPDIHQNAAEVGIVGSGSFGTVLQVDFSLSHLTLIRCDYMTPKKYRMRTP